VIARVLLIAFAAVLVGAVVSRGGDSPDRVVGYGQVRFEGLGPEKWAQRYRRAHRHELELERKVVELRRGLARQRRLVLASPHVVEAINLACATYGHCSTLWRKAKCETGGTFDPKAENPSSSASGLFQFLDGTWRSTPYRVFSPTSPYASALAAGWMHDNGRGGEWACR
jgi:hypothetical protein